MRKKRLPLSITFLFAGYISLIVLFLVVVFSIQTWLQQAELRYTEQTQIKIAEVFKNNIKSDLPEAFINLREEFPLEIVINTDIGEFVFSSIPGLTLTNARAVIPAAVGAVEASGEIDGKNETYLIWYTIYRPAATTYIKNLFTLQLFFILVSFIIIITITYYLYRYLIKPLTTVKQTITKLENYELDEIEIAVEDEITEGMQRFAISLQDNISIVSRNHTQLEYALQLERERLQNMITVSRGIIHDLKSPLYQTLLENEVFLHRNPNIEENAIAVAQYNVERLDNIMQRITEVLQLLDTNVKEMMEVKDKFDLAQIVREIRLGFTTSLETGDYWLTTDMPENLVIQINKVTIYLIIHNMLTNAIQYAIPETEIILTCFVEAGILHISCENEATTSNIIRIHRSETLFQNTEKADDGTGYVYSTGNGVYLIRELTKILKGEYALIVEGEKVMFNVQIPLS